MSIVFIVTKFPSVKKITLAPLLMLASATNMRYVCVTFDNLTICVTLGIVLLMAPLHWDLMNERIFAEDGQWTYSGERDGQESMKQ